MGYLTVQQHLSARKTFSRAAVSKTLGKALVSPTYF